MITRRLFIVTIALLLASPVALLAASKQELQKRFKERDPEIRQLKSGGVIGETDEGYVDFVEGKSKDADVVEAENADRRELYQLIANDEKTDVETVAKHAAQRNFQKAKSGEHLRVKGTWRKKA